ncbi:tetratricopeptide repeat protein [Nitrosospira sp. NpAV]|uniref:tetratricopeptide repeat protein n=1 Tax=Nitrosospira sp. NpAV TaxID=58133 RepID=UPI0005A1DC4F|nr:tetratricopeptide repeat protein [Nitrosospira sp. NpAV]KIO48474.1 tetratricopeptide repeat protein [Nitrosospira sp. NpAV]
MQPRIVPSTILILALAIAEVPGAFAGTGEVPSADKSEASAGSGGHKHYVQSDMANKPGPDGQLAPRLQNLGSHTFPVSTRNKLAQQYVSQGLNLAYGFNHAEARRAFREAARLDPGLAMAYWGQALVLGPNINAMMEPNEEPQALEIVQQAKSLMAKASPRERALINALEKRYSGKTEHRMANNKAYAEAMREVHQRFPDDLDIAMLYVESMMDLRPWGYWMLDGRPYEGTAEIVALTEEVMRRNPKHPGALHMYIHLMEPTSTPERAEKAADTLLTLMPAAGHMIHMSSHIYQRVGRYADSMKSNRLAIAADEDYIAQCRAQGIYPMMYYPHNIHFLWFAATADGQSKIAIKSAREVAGKIDDAVLKEMPLTAIFRMVPYWTLARFGHWKEILEEPAPPSTNLFLKGSWHYARGLAFVATEQLQQAEQELGTLREIMQDASLDIPLFSKNTARTVLNAAPEVLAGEIAAARGQFDQAIAHLERAVRLEDALIYTEPLEFHFPPRLALGAILLESGRPAEAETVYWEDLRRNRDNGWALYGLMQALRAQKKDDQAALIETRFKKAWARADIELNASRFGRRDVKV